MLQVCKDVSNARLQTVSIVALLVNVVASLWTLPVVVGADIFQDAFPYANDRGDLRLYLAKRGPNYQSVSGALFGPQAGGGSTNGDGTLSQQRAILVNGEDGEEANGGQRKEVFLLEDKDYPKSVFENYDDVGQVSGLAALPSGDMAIFHRSDREWKKDTFRLNNSVAEPASKAQDNLIKNNTIMIIDGETGNPRLGFGANLFYMPHGIASDSRGNLWVTDVARHQVMRLPTSTIHKLLEGSPSSSNSPNSKQLSGHLSRLWPDIILGEAFVPGQDGGHFCKPSEVVVSSDDRLVYVADGYCNKRVMVFTGEGKYLTSFGEEEDMSVVHSLALIEERNLICVADRENGRILCFKAGLDGDLSSLGELELRLNYPIGRVFALATIDPNHLLVSGSQLGTGKFDLAALNPFQSTIKQVWTSSDLLTPHSLARTRDGNHIYAADLSREAHKKVYKFFVIREN